MNTKVKKVCLSNLQELQDIGVKSYLPHYAHLWKPNGIQWYMNRCFGNEFLKNELTDANVEFYIIENDGENIGMENCLEKNGS
jgi:hypothetical protein